MNMNRREFIGGASVAAVGGMPPSSAFESSEKMNTFPVLSGLEFKGLEGAIAPIFTPYGKDGAVNGEMVGRMVEFLIGKGISGFYVGGGTGEHVLLSVDERKYLAESVIHAVAGRVKVIVHVGCTYTEDSVALAKHAEKAGADWIASLGPLVFGQNFDASYYHYSRIAGATALPLMIYCWYRDLDPARERKFFDIPNLKGLKYTGHNFPCEVRTFCRGISCAGRSQQDIEPAQQKQQLLIPQTGDETARLRLRPRAFSVRPPGSVGRRRRVSSRTRGNPRANWMTPQKGNRHEKDFRGKIIDHPVRASACHVGDIRGRGMWCATQAELCRDNMEKDALQRTRALHRLAISNALCGRTVARRIFRRPRQTCLPIWESADGRES